MLRKILLKSRMLYLNFKYKYLYYWFFRMQPGVINGRCLIHSKPKFYAPVRCDGSGNVEIGAAVTFGYGLAPRSGNGEILVQARASNSVVKIGRNTSFSNNVSIISNEQIEIGEDCLIGDFCSFFDCDFHVIDPQTRRMGHGSVGKIVIGNNVWFGSRVIVQKGVSIGNNSIIAPNSVVTQCIPENSIAAGVPAKVIRTI